MSPRVTFGSSAAETVANELGLEENDEGHLVDKETREPVIPSDGDEPMTLDEFAGAGAGSRIFIEKDFNSISSYVEEYCSSE